MPPSTDIDDWNTADTINVNNCYNYATDNLNTAEKGSGGKPTPKVHPATPGATQDLDPYKFRYDADAGIVRMEITCDSLIAACVKLDGIKEEEYCDTHSDCWRIALYFREDEQNWRNRVTWDGFHFAREDQKAGPGGNPPAKWSHKPGIGCKATDKSYNPASGKYDGPPLSDPSDGNKVGPGYKFCGYLCVCPKTKVAYHDPARLVEPGTAMAALFSYENFSSISAGPVLLDAAVFDSVMESVTSATKEGWTDGFGPGRASQRLDYLDEKGNLTRALFISDESVTVWDETIKHIPGQHELTKMIRIK